MLFKEGDKSGQVTIFIIIAVLIVAGVIAYFLVRGNLSQKSLPPEVQAVELSFLNCLEGDTLTGAGVLKTSGGYIELPDFQPGSDFMPFSSELNFLGNPIPYWYYVSGNNFEIEQVPTKKEMETQLEDFIEENVGNCVFDEYYRLGYAISQREPNANVEILEDEIKVALEMDLIVNYRDASSIISNHRIVAKTDLGKLYNSALKVYDYQKNNLFLEEYALDNLRLYAPVDGVEITCSPLVWNADDVFENLSEAIEVNTLALKNSGRDEDYFNLDLPVSEEVRFINSKNWPRTYEVSPSEDNFLITEPVGNQPGLGILGFCYAPYHFVYDLKYPVLIQVIERDDEELFQFPIAVIVQGNNPKVPKDGEATFVQTSEICENRNTPVSVNVYDIKSNLIDEAEIFYECFSERCNIGTTSNGQIQKDFPQCINGFVIAKAEGFKEAKSLFSSVNGGVISIYLEKEYTPLINLKVDGQSYPGNAIISFISDDSKTETIIYPEQKNVGLSEGNYVVQVHIYKDVSFDLGNVVTEQCVDVPTGVFGIERKKCFEVEYPDQLVSKALAGGGEQEYFFLETELSNSKTIEINVDSLPTPNTIDQIQDNYNLFEIKGVEVKFR